MEEKLKTIVDIFDDVFRQLGHPRLLDNKNFKLNTDLQSNNYLRFDRTVGQENEIALSFEISNDGVTFHIDRTSEIPDLSLIMIQMDPKKFRGLLIDILCSRIMREYKGKKTILRLFNKDGHQVRRFVVYRGLTFNFLSRSRYKLYEPIFIDGLLHN